jgi:cytochrome P450
VIALHNKYGEVVRVSPNEISFISGETAWQDIYGFRVRQLKGHLNMQKDPVWYPAPINGAASILVSNDEAHSRGRRVLSHAFSEKALAKQEPLLTRFVDLLVDGLKDTVAAGEGPQDMTDWYVSYHPPCSLIGTGLTTTELDNLRRHLRSPFRGAIGLSPRSRHP